MRKHQNLQLLGDVASRLTPLLQDLVFVGGCTTELLITDEAAVPVRTTKDVDAVMALGSYDAYIKVAEQLRGLGFTEDQSEGAPMCRWRAGELILDVMPDDERALGFTNRWYTVSKFVW